MHNILPETSYGVETENYDGISTTFEGVPVKAAAFYKKASTQTISWNTTSLDGTLTFEATLDDSPSTENYFPVMEVTGTSSDFYNIVGNFTWVRAKVTNFTSGTITSVTYTYN